MEFYLELKPLSVNKAWKGRKFKTPLYLLFERDCMLTLPLPCPEIKNATQLRITYKFGLKNFSRSDADNFIKPIQDILVKKGIIKDDSCKYIPEYHVYAYQSEKDWIQIKIEKIS